MIDVERLARALVRVWPDGSDEHLGDSPGNLAASIAREYEIEADQLAQCVCCSEGEYCRHRCPAHPKANGLDDSGKPWVTA